MHRKEARFASGMSLSHGRLFDSVCRPLQNARGRREGPTVHLAGRHTHPGHDFNEQRRVTSEQRRLALRRPGVNPTAKPLVLHPVNGMEKA